MRTLAKVDIVNAILKDGALYQNANETKKIVEDMLALMKKAIVEDCSLMITGFGKFEVLSKEPRRGRNPATNESIVLEGRKVCVFRLSQKFRHELNGEEDFNV